MSRTAAPRALAVVTDSTAYLPRAELGRHGITEVPLTVVIEGRALEDGTPEAARRLERALGRHGSVTTSRPNPEVFAACYGKLAAAGAREIVSLHLSAEISGTRDAALLAAREASIPVRVVDTRMVAMGLGFAVLAAAAVAEAGGTAEEAEAAALERAASTRAIFCVDTLEHLRRGGRIGAARALLGSALAVKPLLELADGRIEMLDRVRTTNRAVARLEELVVEHAGDRPVDIAIHHLAAAERAEQLGTRLRERLNASSPPHVSEVGAVLGAHTGPGLLGAVVAPR
ncbi:DegV family protein [Streptomyces calidiresistens]|uniref:DegV family EDD domain-containing protein n=1 Tax=Streptomyces calidiresistens TaxID=1485586 RepID=A0A7W3XXA5_9ACTN|nr:DegV family protein [Streptomyces calidiresistens]MBB0230724.1 DegV family EDD domain-containing protein [Streptomyces calidiresistens]